MAINLNLKPVEREIENAFSAVNTFVNDFMTKENLMSIAGAVGDAVLNDLINFAETKLTEMFKTYLSQYDQKLASLIRRINSIIPFPSINDILMGFTNQQECPDNPYLELDPYITGIFFVFINFPQTLTSNTKLNITNLCGFLAKGYTVPTLQIQTVERKSFGNNTLVLPSTKEYEKSVTVTFYDTYNLAIQSIFEAWINSIVDMRSGFHSYKDLTDFKGTMTIVSYTPSMKQQVNVKTFFGVFPTSIPLVEQSRDNINIKETQVTFAFDTI